MVDFASLIHPTIRQFRAGEALDVLQRLSDGAGVPVAHLEQMTLAHVWVRLLDQLRQLAATPEGEAELERLIGQRLSQNS